MRNFVPNHYETLGVDLDATQAEIKAAYRRRVRLLHPDRHAGAGPEVRREAHKAMTSLNQAYRVLSDPASRRQYDGVRDAGLDSLDSSGSPETSAWGASTTDSSGRYEPPARPRQPDECLLCAHQPAIEVTIRRNVGFLLFYRREEMGGSLCRGCGTEAIRDFTNRTLLQGWWGVRSALTNLWILAENGRAYARIRKLEPPRPPDESVAVPFPTPVPAGPPLWRRVGLWVGALVLLMALGAAGSVLNESASTASGEQDSSLRPAEPRSGPAGASDVEALVGTCFRLDQVVERIEEVSCFVPHDGKFVDAAFSRMGCPYGTDHFLASDYGSKGLCVDFDS